MPTPACPISYLPTPACPTSSMPTIPPTAHLHELPTSAQYYFNDIPPCINNSPTLTFPTFSLHHYPTAPPTCSNTLPSSVNYLISCEPTCPPTSSNTQPFVPTYPDKSMPTAPLAYNSMPTPPSTVHLIRLPLNLQLALISDPLSTHVQTTLHLRFLLRFTNIKSP